MSLISFLEENKDALIIKRPIKLKEFIDINKIIIQGTTERLRPVILTALAAALGFFLNLQKNSIEKVIDEIWFSASARDTATYFLPSIMIKTKPAAKTEDLLNLLSLIES